MAVGHVLLWLVGCFEEEGEREEEEERERNSIKKKNI